MFELLSYIMCVGIFIVSIGIPMAITIGGIYRAGVHYLNDTPQEDRDISWLSGKVFPSASRYEIVDTLLPISLWLYVGCILSGGIVELWVNVHTLAKDIIDGIAFVAGLTYLSLYAARFVPSLQKTFEKHTNTKDAHK